MDEAAETVLLSKTTSASHSWKKNKYFAGRSLRRWNHKQKRIKNKEEYQYFDHMKWVEEMNLGISHFGIHPSNLPRDSLQFDVFHL